MDCFRRIHQVCHQDCVTSKDTIRASWWIPHEKEHMGREYAKCQILNWPRN